MIDQFLILGCGFTGMRVARRLLSRGASVVATTRVPRRLAAIEAAGARVVTLEGLSGVIRPGMRVLHSIPPPMPELLQMLGDSPARVVYLSTTGVYGAAEIVNEHTPAAPRSPRERLRVEAEQEVLTGPWSALVLRPAAIYGPGRGAHLSMRSGTKWVSRIHVDDLAAIAEAALLSEITGAYPVADDEPCRSVEIARFCAELLGVPLPSSASGSDLPGRRVDGSEIRCLLNVQLQYPSYQSGIPASIAEERHAGLE